MNPKVLELLQRDHFTKCSTRSPSLPPAEPAEILHGFRCYKFSDALDGWVCCVASSTEKTVCEMAICFLVRGWVRVWGEFEDCGGWD